VVSWVWHLPYLTCHVAQYQLHRGYIIFRRWLLISLSTIIIIIYATDAISDYGQEYNIQAYRKLKIVHYYIMKKNRHSNNCLFAIKNNKFVAQFMHYDHLNVILLPRPCVYIIICSILKVCIYINVTLQIYSALVLIKCQSKIFKESLQKTKLCIKVNMYTIVL